MFEFLRKHNRLMQGVLFVLIVPSFVLFGIQGYNGMTKTSHAVAKVDGSNVTEDEWEFALRNQIDEARARAPNVSGKEFDNAAFRQHVMDAMLRQKVLEKVVQDEHLGISDARLLQMFESDERYEPVRNSDGSINKGFLASKGVSVAQFEQQLRHEYSLRQVLSGVIDSSPKLPQTGDIAFAAFTEERQIKLAQFKPASYGAQVNVTDAQAKQYFNDPVHAKEFVAPAQVSLQYVILDMDSVKAQITLSDDQVHKYYEENIKRFTTPEERHTSHILIKVAPSASAQDKQAALVKAQKLLEQLRRNPAEFADLARKNSDDPGSAAQGGDLGFIQRGAMVKPFEDGAYALKLGQISEPILTDYGYHLIVVSEIRGGQVQPFDQVKAQIISEIKDELATAEYAKAAEHFGNLLDQSDTMQEVALGMKLPMQSAEHVSRTPIPNADPKAAATNPLSSDKFLQTVFDASNLKSARNSEPIEIAPNRLVGARVLKYSPERALTFDEAKALVFSKVKAQEALRLARLDGAKQLAAWRQLPTAPAAMGPLVALSRLQTHDLSPALVQAAMQIPAKTLPAWQGQDLGPDGYAVIEVVSVGHPAMPVDKQQAAAREYVKLWSMAEATAYVADLQSRYRAKITPYGQGLVDKSSDGGNSAP